MRHPCEEALPAARSVVAGETDGSALQRSGELMSKRASAAKVGGSAAA